MKLNTVKRVALSAAMFGLFGTVTSQALEDTQRELDIIIRDFEVTHPDFENFQEEAYNSIVNGGKNNVGAMSTWKYEGMKPRATGISVVLIMRTMVAVIPRLPNTVLRSV